MAGSFTADRMNRRVPRMNYENCGVLKNYENGVRPFHPRVLCQSIMKFLLVQVLLTNVVLVQAQLLTIMMESVEYFYFNSSVYRRSALGRNGPTDLVLLKLLGGMALNDFKYYFNYT